jgi:8-oxo-dGTP diphosphatase
VSHAALLPFIAVEAEEALNAVDVVAAVVDDGQRYLVTRRQAGVHLAGMWEFPGGKVRASESQEQALRREMLEELGVDVAVDGLVLSTSHSYPDRTVTLHFYKCRLLGSPTPQLGQQMRWVTRSELQSLEFPPADADLIALLTDP